MDCIDFRSDTVVWPTQRMRDAMYSAELGDDNFHDDPTVIELEQFAAGLLGKEAAIFVPSGTFGNQMSYMTHCKRGNEIILADDSHSIQYEAASITILSGATTRTLCSEQGILDPLLIENAIRKDKGDPHLPESALLAMDNPTIHGRVYPLQRLAECYAVAKKYGLSVHIDGSRLFNAAAALGVEGREIVKYCDSVMFCLSKGLCAPAGSIVCGSKAFIERARYSRKIMGGAMRQAGVLAAAGLVALKEQLPLIKEDNRICRLLGEELNKLNFVEIDLKSNEINMCFCTFNKIKVYENDTEIMPKLQSFLKEKGIKVFLPANTKSKIRLITHYYIREKEINEFISCLKQFFKQYEQQKQQEEQKQLNNSAQKKVKLN